MKYAKLSNGRLSYAPNKITHDGKHIFNPPPDVLAELGYLPVENTDMPTDAPSGKHYESGWTQTDTAIIQTWTLEDDPVWEDPEPETTMADLEAAVERGLTT